MVKIERILKALSATAALITAIVGVLEVVKDIMMTSLQEKEDGD